MPDRLCPTCGTPLDGADAACPFDVPEAQAPWRADYEAMARGLMTHAEHQVLVARWALHDPTARSAAAQQRMQGIAQSAWGQGVKLFEYGGA